jgi:Transglycosylase SLT domain
MRVRYVALVMGLALTTSAVMAETPDECAAPTARVERTYGIPEGLLDAISKVESGRRDGGRVVAWPWTINVAGSGRVFPTKAEAMAAVGALQAAGARSIDVGCMQVNLQWHPQAFATLEQAFDPEANVAYAGRFLKGLYEATGQWPLAASYYHSQTPSLAAEYLGRLMAMWTGEASQLAEIAPPRATRRGESRARVVTLAAIDPLPQLTPRPPSSLAVEDMRRAWREQAQANHLAAIRIADAYRLARIVEARMRDGN